MTADENQLMLRVVDGDRHAFVQLVEAHLRPLEVFATRMLADAAEAQDVAQETLLRLWQRAAAFDPQRGRLSTWLHQIAHNLCIDRLRKLRRVSNWNESLDDTPAPAVDTLVDERHKAVSMALSHLPERQRSALLLTYYQELTNREVAGIMGISIRALESLLVRSRAALKQSLEETV